MTIFDNSQAHGAAVAALQASYSAIPAGQPVRLSKPTSNLFRPRSVEPVAGLDTSQLRDVISVDPQARTADVQGMCTYERLVEVTLSYGLMPLVVPQLKTITLGGAVTGLGIESTSFRSGLPHESVLELDILTGSGELLTASATQHPDLFAGFPNSYGSLGYASRLRIELEPVKPYVALRHVRFHDLDVLASVVGDICATGEFGGEPVEFLDGVMFSADESYLTLGRGVDWPRQAGVAHASDYTGQQIYYRSIRDRERDCLSISDYLWRWDTDWFWCSGALGAQNRYLRRIWPSRYRRSDVYRKIIGLEYRYGAAAAVDRLMRRPPRERVIQDVEIPLRNISEFLRWFAANVEMSPVWLCPLRLRTGEDGRVAMARTPTSGAAETPWPLYPLEPAAVYVNAGFWGTVPIRPDRVEGDVNRMIEDQVAALHGHKSLYSDAYYDEETFYAMYGGTEYRALKRRYDPEHRLTGLYEKAVGRR